ncbi:MAG: TIGR00730 family Rossman fold protein [Myxococcaceae bacterium]
MQSVCVFCGSRPGSRPDYLDAAKQLGRVLASSGRTLVYGGASIGMMGALADAALEAGGRVIGVMPHGLARREIAHGFLTEFHAVGSMHERKALMEKRSDGFIAMPGGFGTLDETFEIITWAQLGMHTKPVGFLNVRGFFDPLMQMVENAIESGFVPAEHRALLLVDSEAEDLLSKMDNYVAPTITGRKMSTGV